MKLQNGVATAPSTSSMQITCDSLQLRIRVSFRGILASDDDVAKIGDAELQRENCEGINTDNSENINNEDEIGPSGG